MTFIKICLLALGALAVIMTVRQFKPDYAVFISVCAGTAMLAYALSSIEPVFEYVSEIAGISAYSTYFSVLLKAVGIGMASSFTCEILRDAGESSLASKIDLCAKTAILLIALPIIRELIKGVISNAAG